MRLFIAIDFSPANKELLHQTACLLKQQLPKGKLPEATNYHLTLAFLGESEEKEKAVFAMEQAASRCHSFTLQTSNAGRFRRPGGDVCWLGLKEEKELLILQRLLVNQLTAQGFDLEDRPYQPHLTLLREATPPGDFNWTGFSRKITPVQQKVEQITLMQSQRIKNKLVYTPLAQVPLADAK